MKNEKHVALAKALAEKWYAMPYEGQSNGEDKRNLIGLIAAALSQVEADALASKVVFPDVQDIKKFLLSEDFQIITDPYLQALKFDKFIRSQLTLAPTEPEVKVQGFDDIFNSFFDSLPMEDRTSEIRKMYWQAANHFFKAGQKSKGIKLPEKSNGSKDCYDGNDNCNHDTHIECDANIMYDKGFNAAIDAVKSLNEGDE